MMARRGVARYGGRSRCAEGKFVANATTGAKTLTVTGLYVALKGRFSTVMQASAATEITIGI